MRLSAFLLIPTRGIFLSLQHSHLFLLLLTVSSVRVITSRGCFRFDEEMKACAKKYNLPVPNDQPVGYDFGYGSLNETEEMCRTRGHITIFQCMQRILENKCRSNPEERYLKTIWSFTLDTRRSEQAATYLCKEHNLQIFRRHMNGCLRMQEKNAEICAQTRNSTMSEVVHALQSESAKSHPTPDVYLDRLKSILEKYECKSIKGKLDCLHNLLQETCHPDVTLLILNYFKETLPPGCVFFPSRGVIHKSPISLSTSPEVPIQIPTPQNRQLSHMEVMSDFPHGRYVNDDVFYDDRVILAFLTSSAISLLFLPLPLLSTILVMIIAS